MARGSVAGYKKSIYEQRLEVSILTPALGII